MESTKTRASSISRFLGVVSDELGDWVFLAETPAGVQFDGVSVSNIL